MTTPNMDLAEPKTAQVSEARRTWRRFCCNRLALVGLGAVILICLVAILSPRIAPYDFAEQDVRNAVHPPSAEHWLGTDQWGRDIFSRIIVGSRVSLSVGSSRL